MWGGGGAEYDGEYVISNIVTFIIFICVYILYIIQDKEKKPTLFQAKSP